MGEIEIKADNGEAITVLSNLFIERFMPEANGAYVKVYLYLIYCRQSGLSFSLHSACDFLGDTEKDIMRAITYWEKAGLLALEKSGNQLKSLKLISPDKAIANSEIAQFIVQTSGTGLSVPVLEEAETMTCIRSEEDLHSIMENAEKYIERLLSSSDISLICDLYEKVNFSPDLIIHLFKYCAEVGKTDSKYIEKVALNWADEGIRSVEQAQEFSSKYNTNYKSIMKAFGLNRLPGEIEKEYIDKWIHIFSMPLEVILAACNRSLLNTNKPDFKYTDKILKTWNDASCRSLEAIEKEDKLHAAMQAGKTLSAPSVNTPNTRFNSFPQRNYSEDTVKELEKKLLKTHSILTNK